MAYKGYRIRISKETGRAENEEMQFNTANEISFNPEGGYSAQGGSGNGASEKVNSLRGGTVNAIIVQTAKKAISYGISNYGNLTGDYITQANVQGILELGGMVATAATGPIGSIAVIGDLAVREINRQVELTKKNQNTQLLRARTGMIGLSGGRL